MFLFSELYLSVNPILQYVQDKDKIAYIHDYLQALKTGYTAQELGIDCGEKIFSVTLKLIVVMGMKH